MPIQASLTMRYRIYSDLLLIFCYGFLMTSVTSIWSAPRRRSVSYAMALGMAVLFCMVSDRGGYRYLVDRRERIDIDLEAYEADNTKSPYTNLVWGNGPQYFRSDANLLLNEVRRLGLYQIPSLPPERALAAHPVEPQYTSRW